MTGWASTRLMACKESINRTGETSGLVLGYRHEQVTGKVSSLGNVYGLNGLGCGLSARCQVS